MHSKKIAADGKRQPAENCGTEDEKKEVEGDLWVSGGREP
jgi:hypothetical protein